MREWCRSLWTEEAKFIGLIRGFIAIAGAAATQIPAIPQWIGIFMLAGSQFISAGDKDKG